MEKKTIVLMVSKFFPAYHPRAGQKTGFADNILSGVKLHTIRKNYELWKERAEEINSGKAVLSQRHWEGKAYRSKQEEFYRLKKIGVQKLTFKNDRIAYPIVDEGMVLWSVDRLAKNDGLAPWDFEHWFKPYDLSEPMAIIHFTDFRY
jgi:hypothetical protein